MIQPNAFDDSFVREIDEEPLRVDADWAALGRKTPLVELPWVGHQSPLWEREPLRWLGARAAQALLASTDHADARGRRYPVRELLLRAMDLDS